MKRYIRLPDVEAVKEFVRTVDMSKSDVLVSKAGYSYQIDGSSIIGMMVFAGEVVLAETGDCTEEMLKVIDKYTITEETIA